MILLKKDIDSDELKKIEEESQRQALAYITPIKEKLENSGYTVDYKFTNEKKPLVEKTKFYVCELSIFPNSISKSEAKKQFKLKIFRMVLFEKKRTDKNNFNVKTKRDMYFKTIITFALKKLTKGNIEKAAKDNAFDFFNRVYYPSRAGQLAYQFKGKDYQWLRIVTYIIIIFTIAILTALKDAEFWSSMGYGYY